MKVFVVSKGMPTEKYPINGIFEFDQAKALAKVGLNVAMLVIDFRSISYKRKYGLFSYTKDNVSVFELSLPLGVYRRALPLLQQLLIILYKKAVKSFGKPDIIHAHFYSIAAIASVLKRKFNIPFVVTEHSSKLNKNILNISELDAQLAKLAYTNCDKLIAVSNALSRNLKTNFGVDSIIIQNIVDVSNFQYVKRDKKDKFTFVSVGNLIPLKRFDLLLRAFAQAFENDNSVRIVIIGGGVEYINLQNLVNQLNISKKVKFTGEICREELKKILYESDAFVLASSSETFGLSYIEAMASGLPVIATDCGGPSDFVNHNNGFLIPVDDKEKLVTALKNMRDNAYNFNGKEISDLIVKKYSPVEIGELLKNVYNLIIR